MWFPPRQEANLHDTVYELGQEEVAEQPGPKGSTADRSASGWHGILAITHAHGVLHSVRVIVDVWRAVFNQASTLSRP